jgi:type III secretory pathway lipoprotein EscJ
VYHISDQKAKEVLSILTQQQIEELKQMANTGGLGKKK